MTSAMTGISPGMIIWQGRAQFIAVDWAFLVTDMVAWARALQLSEEEEAEECRLEGDTDMAALHARNAERLAAWLNTQEPVQLILHAHFELRQQVRPWVVTQQNLADYIQMLVSQGEPVSPSSVPVQWILDADMETPTLWAVETLRPALRYTSKELLSVSETPEALALRAEEINERIRREYQRRQSGSAHIAHAACYSSTPLPAVGLTN